MKEKENGFEKMTSENESKDGVVELSKEQELESRKICQKFEPRDIGEALKSDNCRRLHSYL